MRESGNAASLCKKHRLFKLLPRINLSTMWCPLSDHQLPLKWGMILVELKRRTFPLVRLSELSALIGITVWLPYIRRQLCPGSHVLADCGEFIAWIWNQISVSPVSTSSLRPSEDALPASGWFNEDLDGWEENPEFPLFQVQNSWWPDVHHPSTATSWMASSDLCNNCIVVVPFSSWRWRMLEIIN